MKRPSTFHDDLAIIMQGRVHQNTVPALRNYKRFGHVVLSTYDIAETERYLDQCAMVGEDLMSGVKLVFNSDYVASSTYNNQNVFLQAQSTRRGLEQLLDLNHTPSFAIKVRTDKYYHNLEPFITAVKREDNQNKIVCGNVHFRPAAVMRYHMGDKIFGGHVEHLVQCTSMAVERCVNDKKYLDSGIYEDSMYWAHTESGMILPPTIGYNPDNTDSDNPCIYGITRQLAYGYSGVFPEVLLATSYLIAKRERITRDIETCRRLMHRYFDCVPVELLVPYINKLGTNVIEHNAAEIMSMLDY